MFSFSNSETPLSKEREARLENRNKRKLFTSSETPSTFKQIENVKAVEESSTNLVVHLPINETPATNELGTQVNFEHVYGCIKRFMNDDKAIAFYTGFESYKKFYFVYLTFESYDQ